MMVKIKLIKIGYLSSEIIYKMLQTDTQKDNVKTLYPTTNKICRGVIKINIKKNKCHLNLFKMICSYCEAL